MTDEFAPSVRELILKEDQLIKESSKLRKELAGKNIEFKSLMEEIVSLEKQIKDNQEKREHISATLIGIQLTKFESESK